MSDHSSEENHELIIRGFRPLAKCEANLIQRGLASIQYSTERIVHFPEDVYLGQVYICDPTDRFPASETGFKHDLIDAIGDIRIPKGQVVLLYVDKNIEDELSHLQLIDPQIFMESSYIQITNSWSGCVYSRISEYCALSMVESPIEALQNLKDLMIFSILRCFQPGSPAKVCVISIG